MSPNHRRCPAINDRGPEGPRYMSRLAGGVWPCLSHELETIRRDADAIPSFVFCAMHRRIRSRDERLDVDLAGHRLGDAETRRHREHILTPRNRAFGDLTSQRFGHTAGAV